MSDSWLESVDGPRAVSRRTFMKAAAGITAGTALMPAVSMAQCNPASPGTVRDRLWLFGTPRGAGSNWTHRRSLMSPVEGAYYLGVPNLIMVQTMPSQNDYGFRPYESPLKQYAIKQQPLKRVLWSITGSGGYTTEDYRREVLGVAKSSPNCVGLYMDDFFFTSEEAKSRGKRAALTLDQLTGIRKDARAGNKPLEIWVTFYTLLLSLPLQDYLKLIDVLTIWTWKSEDLKDLEHNFSKIESLAPHSRKTLGCYFYDFTTRQPLTVAQMKYQCETGLGWLRDRRIEGMVFLGNNVEDLGYESVEWTRNWINKVGAIAI